MSLWVDKHRPKSLDHVDYHEDISERFSALAATGDLPHLLVYGPSGAGKKTRVMGLLKKLYGPSVEKISTKSHKFVTPSKRELELGVICSAYHLEVTPSDMGNNDRLVIQQLLKETAETQQVDLNAKQRFKVVIINEADSLSRDAQAALRRTMEKYTKNIRLILLTNSTSNIIAPIRSRTLLVRVAAPTEQDIVNVLEKVAAKEHVDLENVKTLEKIASHSDRNLRKALLTLETLYTFAGSKTVSENTPIPTPDWEMVIGRIARELVSSRTPATLLAIRSLFYELLSHCIPPSTILKELTYRLIPVVPANLRVPLISAAATYEHRLKLGAKYIFHLEAFCAKVMVLLEE